MKDIINNLQESNSRKIQLTIAINFISSKDTMKSLTCIQKGITEIMIHDEADEVMEEVFNSLLNRYQTGWETLMRGSDFISDYVNLLIYKCDKRIK